MYKDLIAQLRATESRSKRQLLDKAAAAIERLEKEVMPNMVRCSDCVYRMTCQRTLEIFPRMDAKGYLHGIVHACEYGEMEAEPPKEVYHGK